MTCSRLNFTFLLITTIRQLNAPHNHTLYVPSSYTFLSMYVQQMSQPQPATFLACLIPATRSTHHFSYEQRLAPSHESKSFTAGSFEVLTAVILRIRVFWYVFRLWVSGFRTFRKNASPYNLKNSKSYLEPLKIKATLLQNVAI